MAVYSMDVLVSFGDCDPAGIVYYPNFFTWVDRCFHTMLHEKLGAMRLCARRLRRRALG